MIIFALFGWKEESADMVRLKRSLSFFLTVLLVFDGLPHSKAQGTNVPQVLDQLNPLDGDWWLALCAEGNGGFYA